MNLKTAKENIGRNVTFGLHRKMEQAKGYIVCVKKDPWGKSICQVRSKTEFLGEPVGSIFHVAPCQMTLAPESTSPVPEPEKETGNLWHAIKLDDGYVNITYGAANYPGYPRKAPVGVGPDGYKWWKNLDDAQACLDRIQNDPDFKGARICSFTF